MDPRAAKLNIRFSFSPNLLGYCGRDTAEEKYRRCLKYGRCEGVAEELTHFIVLNPYLQTIARITGLSPFSYEVAECYWMGNALLDQVRNEHYPILLEEFAKQGIPDWLITELSQKPPSRFIPTHLFQVLHIGVGKASGAVPFSLASINNCMLRWGTVTAIEKERAEITVSSLNDSTSHHSLREEIISARIHPDFSPKIELGDTVTAHWGTINAKLTQKQFRSISYWTNQVLTALS
ncbi:hypothetical protein KBD81_04465 [Candidatus Woesebacteria bacterium]|nr:hypothetical protein [Candidatus Woesebacteria bacterium]